MSLVEDYFALGLFLKRFESQKIYFYFLTAHSHNNIFRADAEQQKFKVLMFIRGYPMDVETGLQGACLNEG